MPDNISKLYNALQGTYELGSEDDFRKYLSDSKKREALRKELQAEYDTGDEAAFSAYLGFGKPAPAPAPAQPVVKQTTGQINPTVNTSTQPKQEEQPQKQGGWQPTWQEKMGMQMQLDETMRQVKQSQQDFNTRMENIRKGNTLGKTSEVKFNPESGKMERRYYTTHGDEVTTPLEQSRLNLKYRDEWEATTPEGRKHREKRIQNDFERRVGASLDKYDPDNAAAMVWQQAEDKASESFREYVDRRRQPTLANALHDMADASNVTGGVGMDNIEYGIKAFTEHLKYHDLQRMADDAWNMLGKEKQQSIIEDMYGALKNRYPQATEQQLQQAATEMAREQSDRRMYELAVAKNAPKDAAEYFIRKVAAGNAMGTLMQAAARAQAGTTGDWEAREDAEQRFEKQGHKVAGIAGTVTGFALDPLTWASAGAGGAAVKGTTWLGGKMIGEAAMRKFGTTLGGRMLGGAIGGAVNFGTYEAGSEALDQMKWGGYIDEETGERKDGFSFGNVAGRAGHGLMMGAVTGVIAPYLGNVSDKLVRATESTVGKMGIRAGELGVGTVAEGTIFAVPEIIDTYGQYGDLINSLSDESSPNYIADEQERAAKIEELRNSRGDALMDVWTDNMAMIAGFKAQHLLKSAPRVIYDLARSKNGKAGFETRLRSILDGRGDLALTEDEKKELERRGYGDLKDLTEEYSRYAEAKEEYDKARPTTTDASRMIEGGDGQAELPYNRFVELMTDNSVSEAARAKMYYYLTGHGLPMSTVMGSSVLEDKDADGNVTGYTVQSFGANGVITSRSFGDKKRADVEANRINRQAELNGFDVGERYYDWQGDNKRMYEACETVAEETGAPANLLFDLMKRKTEAMNEVELEWAEKILNAYNGLGDKYGSSEVRTAINEEFGVDVDKAIRKERNRRSEQEQKAVDEYASRLFADVKRKQEEAAERGEAPVDPDAPTSNSQIAALLGIDDGEQGDPVSAAFNRGHEADVQERQDIAIDLTDPNNSEAQEAWNGVVQRINEDAAYMVAQQREQTKQMQHTDGSLRPAILKEKDSEGNDQQVYIVDGNVQMMPDGSVVDKASSDNIVVIYNPATGERKQIDPSADTGISSLGEVTTAEQREADIERSRQEYVQAQIDEAQGTVRFVPGQQLVLPTGEEAVVVATDADGENITVALGDGTQATVQRSELQRIRDEKAAADYRQRHSITEEPATQQPEASTPAQPQADGRVAGAPADYTADMELTIRDEDGTEKPAMVMGRVRYENGSFVPDANGNIIEYFMDGEVKHDHEDKLVDKVVSHTAYTEGSDEVQNGKDEVQSNIEIPPTHTYNLDDDLTLQTEDGTVQGTVIAEENGDGLITVQTEQPIGGRVVNLFTREQLDAMTGAAQPADMYKEQVVDAASTISEEKTADGHVSPTATQNAGRMEIPVEKRGKKEVKQYHRVPVERTLEELYDGGLDQQQVDGYVDAQIAEAAKEAERLSARKVPVTTDLDAYKQAVADNNAALADAEERKAYWERVRGEIKRITHSDETERLAVDADKEDLDYGEPRDGYEFAAMRLGSNGIRITPESFRRETGYGRGEVRQMAGVLARAENGGVSVERAAEMLVESDEGDRFFGGDSSVARDVILDVLQDGNPRGYVRRRREAQAAAQRRAEESERDAFFMEAYHMSYEDYMAYEEQLIPSFIEKYRNFDAREFDGMDAEKVATESQQTGQTELKANENNGREEQTGVVAEGGGTGNGGGGEVLPAEGSADGAGSGIGNRRGGEAAAGREGAAADGAVPEGAPGGGTAETSDASVEVRDNDGRGGNGSLTGREQGDLAQTESLKYQLSDEVDENGQQFVLNSEGNIEFGRIGEETGLTPAPILLSEGVITNQNTNAGYGLVHIEARHGDQIRAAGYNTVLEFIEEVAKNYEVIRKGNDRNGRETYMLQLTDKHNNTLMVELSGDGTYWNINTAGIFKTSYGANRTVVYNRHTTDNQPAGTDEASLSGEQSGTTPSTRMNAPTQRGLSETSAKTEPQQPNNAVSDGSSLSADEERGITPAEPNGEPTVSAGKGSASSADGKGNGGENDAAANLGSTDSPEATDIPGYGRGEVREQKAGEGAFVPTENEGMFVEAMAEHLNAMGVETFADAETGQRMLDEVNGKAALSRGQKRLLDTAPLIQKEGSPADISSSDGAKVLQNLNNLASELEKISSWRKNILSEIAKAIGAKAYGSSSKYATFTTKNGQTVTVRLGNHNAQTESFDVNGEANGISIVISKRANNGINNNGKAHLVEFFYPEIALRKAEGKPLAEIVRSIEQALYSGEYKDTTGLAERE